MVRIDDGNMLGRNRSTERLTEEQIEDALPSSNRRLSDGGGLSVLIKPNGDKYFQFRAIVDGKEMSCLLGKYPEMSLDAARKRAKLMYLEVQRSRSKRKRSLFSVRLVDDPTQKSRQALDMRDVADLLRGLDRFVLEQNIDYKIRLAIHILVHLPVTLDQLMSARKSDIDFKTGEWIIRELHEEVGVERKSSKLAVIPSKLLGSIHAVSIFTGSTDYVFPSLSLNGKKSLSREIRLAFQNVCPHQSIKLGDFRGVFKRAAEKKSYFKVELINEALNHSEYKGQGNRGSYLLQRAALSNWWEDEVRYSKFAAGVSV